MLGRRQLVLLFVSVLMSFSAWAQNPVRQAQSLRTSGTITTSTSTVSAGAIGYGVATVTVNGTYAGVTINFEFSDDGSNWFSAFCARTDSSILEASEVLPSNQLRAWDCGVFAATNFRVRASAYSSGTANIGITMSAAAIEPALTVGGTFWQATQPVSGTFWQATQPVSGTFWQATQPVSGTFWQATQPVSVADGSDTTLGAKADAKSTATDTTAISLMSVMKQISASVQAPPSQAVTGTFWQATQPVSVADGSDITLGAKADAKSTATDTTAISMMSVLKQISASVQAPPSQAVTGTVTAAQTSGPSLETAPVATATTTNTALGCHFVSAATTNATNCKNGAGNIYGFRFVNTTTTIYYLRMYNLTSAPTCSSATGFIESIPIPPAGAAGQANGIVSMESFGEGYTTGIGFCFTAGSSSTDNTAAAVGVFGTVLYK